MINLSNKANEGEILKKLRTFSINSPTLKFRARIEGLHADEQPQHILQKYSRSYSQDPYTKINNFLQANADCQWPAETTIHILRSLLTDKEDKAAIKNHINFENAFSALMEKWFPRKHMTKYLSQLRSIRLNKNEAIQDYTARFKHLLDRVNLCRPRSEKIPRFETFAMYLEGLPVILRQKLIDCGVDDISEATALLAKRQEMEALYMPKAHSYSPNNTLKSTKYN